MREPGDLPPHPQYPPQPHYPTAGVPESEDSVLERIVRETQQHLPMQKRSQPETLLLHLATARPAPRDFIAALRRPGLGLIAEVKKGSPGKGPFAIMIDHVDIARDFRAAGAVAVSVLTSSYFYADNLELDEVAMTFAADERNGTAAPPLLRKEFHLDRYQVLEARSLGADAYLLIAKILDPETLKDLIAFGQGDLGMIAFVEVTNEQELEMAVAAGARTIGINNRNLHTFEEDLSVSERLRALVPPEIPVVSASGVRTRDDLARMRAAGVDAVLIGEALCTVPDVRAKIEELFGDA